MRRRVPLARELPPAQQLHLKKHIQVLLAEEPFIGCAGLEVNDEIRVTIAAQSAFLLLARGGSFGNLREVWAPSAAASSAANDGEPSARTPLWQGLREVAVFVEGLRYARKHAAD